MSSTNAHRYRFDTFEVDPANRLLLRNGQEVRVTGRVFDILLVFVENPGRLLEKSELIESVWHGDFVEDSNLTRNISSLRKALGDTARQHRYITTVQGHGYRFIAEVSDPMIGEAPYYIPDRAARSTNPLKLEPGRTPVSARWLWAIPLLVLLILVIWAAVR